MYILIYMTTTTATIQAAFNDFSKWETYRTCYIAITNKTATMKEIQDIAWTTCEIYPDVIEMRINDLTRYAADMK